MSTRLELIAKQIKSDEKVLDVGTDHALLPIHLYKNNITKNIVASDINTKPLEFALNNIKKEGLENKIHLILMNGLQDVDINTFDTIIIAGMGATTIGEIISKKEFKGRYIIHSTTHIPDVRRYIQQIGHTITNEWVNQEGKIYNIIIETRLGKMKLTDQEIYLGPCLINKPQESNSYYKFLLKTLEKNANDSGIKELKIEERKWLEKQLWNEKKLKKN